MDITDYIKGKVQQLFEVKGLKPRNLKSGEEVVVVNDPPLGHGGTMGNKKPNPDDGDRHFSVMSSTLTKVVDNGKGGLKTSNGRDIEDVRKRFDIKRAPREEIKDKP